MTPAPPQTEAAPFTARATTPSAGDEPSGTVVLEQVTKIFGDTHAVDGIDLHVEAGEFLSLLGPSGCGKTTTLRMLAGFEHPDAGEIRISGQSVLGVPPYRRNVNTVFQAYALFPHMSVAENIAYGLQQKRVAKAEVRERVLDALDMVQMRKFADRKPTQLSGGQQQRVALARALVNRPSVLLLDEPLGALDRQLREEMQLELKLLQSRLGITFIFVTHDQGEALSMSDRIAVMRDGRIEQLADADTIYGSPSSAYVAAFIGQQNFIDGTLSAPNTLTTEHGIVHSTGTDPVAVGERARAAIRPELVRVTDAASVGSTAEAAEHTAAAASGAPQENSLPGTLIGVSHQGETMQYLIAISPTLSLISRQPRPTAPDLRAGDAVRCSWASASVQLFAADEAADAAGYAPPPTH